MNYFLLIQNYMPHPADIKAYPKLCASHYGVERKVLFQGGKNSLT